MASRVIHIPLSGGDRKHQAKEIRRALGMHNELLRQAAIARSEGEAKIQRADYLECEAWNAIMICGGPSAPSPTIAQCLNARINLIEIRCDRCFKIDRIKIETINRPHATQIHELEDALVCRTCTLAKTWGKQRAHILGLTCAAPPDPEQPSRIKQSRRSHGG